MSVEGKISYWQPKKTWRLRLYGHTFLTISIDKKLSDNELSKEEFEALKQGFKPPD